MARHWQAPHHRLTRVELKLVLPNKENDYGAHLYIEGRSTSLKRPLWTYSETWDEHLYPEDLGPVDVAHHALLCAFQDRPESRYMLDRSFNGETVWEQLRLPGTGS